MVIHDLRNPTNQVQYVAKCLLTQLKDIKFRYVSILAARDQLDGQQKLDGQQMLQ